VPWSAPHRTARGRAGGRSARAVRATTDRTLVRLPPRRDGTLRGDVIGWRRLSRTSVDAPRRAMPGLRTCSTPARPPVAPAPRARLAARPRPPAHRRPRQAARDQPVRVRASPVRPWDSIPSRRGGARLLGLRLQLDRRHSAATSSPRRRTCARRSASTSPAWPRTSSSGHPRVRFRDARRRLVDRFEHHAQKRTRTSPSSRVQGGRLIGNLAASCDAQGPAARVQPDLRRTGADLRLARPAASCCRRSGHGRDAALPPERLSELAPRGSLWRPMWRTARTAACALRPTPTRSRRGRRYCEERGIELTDSRPTR